MPIFPLSYFLRMLWCKNESSVIMTCQYNLETKKVRMVHYVCVLKNTAKLGRRHLTYWKKFQHSSKLLIHIHIRFKYNNRLNNHVAMRCRITPVIRKYFHFDTNTEVRTKTELLNGNWHNWHNDSLVVFEWILIIISIS